MESCGDFGGVESDWRLAWPGKGKGAELGWAAADASLFLMQAAATGGRARASCARVACGTRYLGCASAVKACARARRVRTSRVAEAEELVRKTPEFSTQDVCPVRGYVK